MALKVVYLKKYVSDSCFVQMLSAKTDKSILGTIIVKIKELQLNYKIILLFFHKIKVGNTFEVVLPKNSKHVK